MLKDFIQIPNNLNAVLACIGMGGSPERFKEGLYWSSNFNFTDNIRSQQEFRGDDAEHEKWDYFRLPCKPYKEEYDEHEYTETGTSGVCDDPEQLLEFIPSLVSDPDNFYCIGFTKIVAADQSPDGGWRWHKWGRYIGVHKVTREYIYDQREEIPFVYYYRIVKLRPQERK